MSAQACKKTLGQPTTLRSPASHRHDRIDVDEHIVPLIQSLAAQERPHCGEIRRLDEKHEAMDAAKLGDQSGRRANDLLPFPACEGSEKVFLNAARFLTRRLLFPMLHDERHIEINIMVACPAMDNVQNIEAMRSTFHYPKVRTGFVALAHGKDPFTVDVQ